MSTPQVGTARQTEPTPITQELVNEYVQAVSIIREQEKTRDRLRNLIIESLEYGHTCPSTGPFIVEVSHQERCSASWKDICMAVVSLLGERLRNKAADLIAQMQAEKTTVAQVLIKPNANWRTK